MGRGHKETSHRKRKQTAFNVKKDVLTSLIRESRYHFQPVRLAELQKFNNTLGK